MISEEIRKTIWERLIISLLRERPQFYHEWLSGASPKPLENQGVLVPDAPRMTAWCPKCFDETDVEFFERDNGEATYWRVCCRPIKRISPKTFRVWQVSRDVILSRFMSVLGIKGAMTEIIPSQIWKLGRSGQEQYMYISQFREDDIKTLGPVLGRYPKTVFVTPANSVISRINLILPNRGVALIEVGSLTEKCDVKFDMGKINSIIGVCESDGDNKSSQARRGNRAVNIEKLVTELKEHYRSSRDYYYSTGGNLLPRPTQEQLAKRIGVRQDLVSRCLADPEGKLLKLLWDNAENEKYVLNH